MSGKSCFQVIAVLIGIVVLAVMFSLVGCPGPGDQQVDEPVQKSAEKPEVPAADSSTGDRPAEEAPPSEDESAQDDGKIVAVGQNDFEDEVIQADTPVVIDFWADWCAPCHMIRPTLEELAKEFAGTLKFVSVDVDSNPKLSSKFSVNYLPTVVVIEDGEETQRFVGALSPEQLHDAIAKVINPAGQ